MRPDRPQELLGMLSDAPLFAGLDEAHLRELVAKGSAGAMQLSRAFQQLVRAGAVETTGRTVHIKDRDVLEQVARVRT